MWLAGTVQNYPGAIIGDDVYDISLDNETQKQPLDWMCGLILGIWVLQLAKLTHGPHT